MINIPHSSLQVEGISKTYGDVAVIRNLSLSLEGGALLTLLGPSGCGKSTLLRTIAGFVEPDEGDVRVGGRSVRSLPPERRPSAMVFQNYALFPHLTAADNVAFGPRVQRLGRAEVGVRVKEALELVRVAHLADRFPHQLSGGQQQRVALARCLAVQPQILLLDEPFGALDRNLREEMQVEMRKLQQRLGVTMVVVTHDQDEALALSDQIAVMNNGKIEHLGTPSEVYDRPATRFTASFMGVSNMIPGIVEKTGDGLAFRLANNVSIPLPPMDREAGPAVIAVRPETLRLVNPSVSHSLVGEIVFATMLGRRIKYEIDVEGMIITAIVQREERVLSVGHPAYIAVSTNHLSVYSS